MSNNIESESGRPRFLNIEQCLEKCINDHCDVLYLLTHCHPGVDYFFHVKFYFRFFGFESVEIIVLQK